MKLEVDGKGAYAYTATHAIDPAKRTVAFVHGMRQATTLYIDIALVIAMLGFVSTAALARFLLRGEVIE